MFSFSSDTFSNAKSVSSDTFQNIPGVKSISSSTPAPLKTGVEVSRGVFTGSVVITTSSTTIPKCLLVSKTTTISTTLPVINATWKVISGTTQTTQTGYYFFNLSTTVLDTNITGLNFSMVLFNGYTGSCYSSNTCKTTFTGCTFNKIPNCIFANASFTRCTFTDLTNAVLTGANLTGANLTGANLTSANLTGANLTGANLTGANLMNTNLSSTVITNTVFTGAILNNTKFQNSSNKDISHILNAISCTTSGSKMYVQKNGYVLGPDLDLSSVILSEEGEDLSWYDMSSWNFTGVTFNNVILQAHKNVYPGAPNSYRVVEPEYPINYAPLNYYIITRLGLGYLLGPGINISLCNLNFRNSSELSKKNLSNMIFENADLTGADLTDTNFSGTDLSKAVFNLYDATTSPSYGYTNWTRANLSGANLSGANLNYNNLSGANLTKAILTGAKLANTNLAGAILTGANLIGYDLSYVNLRRAFINNSKLSYAKLCYANLESLDMSFLDLTGVDFTRAELTSVNFTNSKLTGANLSNTTLTGVNLSNATLTGANLTNSNLSNVILTTGTILNGIILKNTILQSVPDDATANLLVTLLGSGYKNINGWVLGSGVSITNISFNIGVDFGQIPLKNVIFNNINLYGSNLFKCDFEGANLTNVYLKESNLSGTNFNKAILNNVCFVNSNISGISMQNVSLTNVEFQDLSDNFNASELATTLGSNYSIVGGYVIGPGLILRNLDLTKCDMANVNMSNVSLINPIIKYTNFHFENNNVIDNNEIDNNEIYNNTIVNNAIVNNAIVNNLLKILGNTNYQNINGYLFGPGISLSGPLFFDSYTFNNLNFSYCDFTNVVFKFCTFKNCVFSNTILDQTEFNNCKIENCKLENCNFSTSTFIKNTFSQMTITNCRFQTEPSTTANCIADLLNSIVNSQLYIYRNGWCIGPNLDLSNYKYTNLSLYNVIISNVNFSNATFDSTVIFNNVTLTNVNLSKADLSNVILTNTTLINVTLYYTKFQVDSDINIGNNLVSILNKNKPGITYVQKGGFCFGKGVSIESLSFSDVDSINGMDLSDSSFTYCDFSKLVLTNINLTNCNLIGTTFGTASGLNMTNAIIQTSSDSCANQWVTFLQSLYTGKTFYNINSYCVGPYVKLSSDFTDQDLSAIVFDTNYNLKSCKLKNTIFQKASNSTYASALATLLSNTFNDVYKNMNGWCIGPGINITNNDTTANDIFLTKTLPAINYPGIRINSNCVISNSNYSKKISNYIGKGLDIKLKSSDIKDDTSSINKGIGRHLFYSFINELYNTNMLKLFNNNFIFNDLYQNIPTSDNNIKLNDLYILIEKIKSIMHKSYSITAIKTYCESLSNNIIKYSYYCLYLINHNTEMYQKFLNNTYIFDKYSVANYDYINKYINTLADSPTLDTILQEYYNDLSKGLVTTNHLNYETICTYSSDISKMNIKLPNIYIQDESIKELIPSNAENIKAMNIIDELELTAFSSASTFLMTQIDNGPDNSNSITFKDSVANATNYGQVTINNTLNLQLVTNYLANNTFSFTDNVIRAYSSTDSAMVCDQLLVYMKNPCNMQYNAQTASNKYIFDWNKYNSFLNEHSGATTYHFENFIIPNISEIEKQLYTTQFNSTYLSEVYSHFRLGTYKDFLYSTGFDSKYPRYFNNKFIGYIPEKGGIKKFTGYVKKTRNIGYGNTTSTDYTNVSTNLNTDSNYYDIQNIFVNNKYNSLQLELEIEIFMKMMRDTDFSYANFKVNNVIEKNYEDMKDDPIYLSYSPLVFKSYTNKKNNINNVNYLTNVKGFFTGMTEIYYNIWLNTCYYFISNKFASNVLKFPTDIKDNVTLNDINCKLNDINRYYKWYYLFSQKNLFSNKLLPISLTSSYKAIFNFNYSTLTTDIIHTNNSSITSTLLINLRSLNPAHEYTSNLTALGITESNYKTDIIFNKLPRFQFIRDLQASDFTTFENSLKIIAKNNTNLINKILNNVNSADTDNNNYINLRNYITSSLITYVANTYRNHQLLNNKSILTNDLKYLISKNILYNNAPVNVSIFNFTMNNDLLNILYDQNMNLNKNIRTVISDILNHMYSYEPETYKIFNESISNWTIKCDEIYFDTAITNVEPTIDSSLMLLYKPDGVNSYLLDMINDVTADNTKSTDSTFKFNSVARLISHQFAKALLTKLGSFIPFGKHLATTIDAVKNASCNGLVHQGKLNDSFLFSKYNVYPQNSYKSKMKDIGVIKKDTKKVQCFYTNVASNDAAAYKFYNIISQNIVTTDGVQTYWKMYKYSKDLKSMDMLNTKLVTDLLEQQVEVIQYLPIFKCESSFESSLQKNLRTKAASVEALNNGQVDITYVLENGTPVTESMPLEKAKTWSPPYGAKFKSPPSIAQSSMKSGVFVTPNYVYKYTGKDLKIIQGSKTDPVAAAINDCRNEYKNCIEAIEIERVETALKSNPNIKIVKGSTTCFKNLTEKASHLKSLDTSSSKDVFTGVFDDLTLRDLNTYANKVTKVDDVALKAGKSISKWEKIGTFLWKGVKGFFKCCAFVIINTIATAVKILTHFAPMLDVGVCIYNVLECKEIINKLDQEYASNSDNQIIASGINTDRIFANATMIVSLTETVLSVTIGLCFPVLGIVIAFVAFATNGIISLIQSEYDKSRWNTETFLKGLSDVCRNNNDSKKIIYKLSYDSTNFIPFSFKLMQKNKILISSNSVYIININPILDSDTLTKLLQERFVTQRIYIKNDLYPLLEYKNS